MAVRLVASIRPFHSTPMMAAKIVRTTVTPDAITVEGIPQPFRGTRISEVVKDYGRHPHNCSLCRLNIKVKYTDVLIIRQFLNPDMKLLDRETTGICDRQHNHLHEVLEQAKTAGLIGLPKSDQVFVAPHRWKKFNVYYEWPKRYTLLPNNNKI